MHCRGKLRNLTSNSLDLGVEKIILIQTISKKYPLVPPTPQRARQSSNSQSNVESVPFSAPKVCTIIYDSFFPLVLIFCFFAFVFVPKAMSLCSLDCLSFRVSYIILFSHKSSHQILL